MSKDAGMLKLCSLSHFVTFTMHRYIYSYDGYVLPNVGKNRRRYRCMEQEKCTRQLVPIAEKNVKYRSSRAVIDLYTAGNVIKNIDHQEDISFWINIKF